MTITAAFVLFSVIWFLVLFLALQINIQTQGDVNEIVHGTHSSSPHNFNMKKRLGITTLITLPIWGLTMWVILSGAITVEMFDFYNIIKN